MCGISGILNSKGHSVDPTIIKRMNDCMSHRGPDADGFFIKDEIALGHRRLSIIDLSENANQPLFDPSGRFVLLFNGEMYNFLDVKKELTDYPFATNSDSEVILAAFLKWGPDCVEKFVGMFIFVIWDLQEHELFICRDRMGVKPLYFYQDEDHFLFASEIRALLASGLVPKKLNTNAVLEFLEFQSIGFPHAAIEGVKQLEAGSWVRISRDKIYFHKYWDVTATKKDFDFGDRKEVQKKLFQLLQLAVERRLISDVPLGAFLSGGIDSSVVVALMANASSGPVNTFNISFEEKEFDESMYANIVAKKFNTRHTEVRLQPTVFLDELENALNSMDTPSGDGINTYVVSKKIRESGLTVALSGVGGDELFAGYPFFFHFHSLQQKRKLWNATKVLRKLGSAFIPLNGSVIKDRMKEFLAIADASIGEAYPVFRQIMSPRLLHSLTQLKDPGNPRILSSIVNNKKNIDRFPPLSQVSIAEYLGYTQHTLLKDTDQMSMAVSLEVREPFFDHQLVEYVLNIPDHIKYPSYPKQLLVETMGDLLPPEIVHRKKQGFLFPWNQWMKGPLKEFCESHIKNISNRSFVNGPALQKRWQQFVKGDKSVRWMEIWLFVILDHWMEKNNVNQ